MLTFRYVLRVNVTLAPSLSLTQAEEPILEVFHGSLRIPIRSFVILVQNEMLS